MVSAGGGGGSGGRRTIRSGQELGRVRCTEGVIETTAAIPLWIHRPRARSAPCTGRLLARHVLARVAGFGAPVGRVGTRAVAESGAAAGNCNVRFRAAANPTEDPPSGTTSRTHTTAPPPRSLPPYTPRFAAGRTYISAEGGGRGDARESRRAEGRVVVLGDDKSRGVARGGLAGDGGAQPTGDGGAESHGVRR